MAEQSLDREQAFVAKLNRFMESLEPHEQQWLAALIVSDSSQQEVQGYALPGAGGMPFPGVPFTPGLSLLPTLTLSVRKAGGEQEDYLTWKLKDLS